MPHTVLAAAGLVGFLVLVVAVSPTTLAQNAPSGNAPEDSPGYVDFSRQPLFDEDDLEIRVSVKGPMIHLVAEASREKDPNLAEMLGELEAVEVHVYRLAEDERDAVRREISRQAGELEAGGWAEAITIHLRRARGHVFLRLVGAEPVGVAALYVGEENEAVFVNIVGRIDPAQIGRLASQFNLDLLSQAVSQSGEEDTQE